MISSQDFVLHKRLLCLAKNSSAGRVLYTTEDSLHAFTYRPALLEGLQSSNANCILAAVLIRFGGSSYSKPYIHFELSLRGRPRCAGSPASGKGRRECSLEQAASGKGRLLPSAA